jgi:hypothetical protein
MSAVVHVTIELNSTAKQGGQKNKAKKRNIVQYALFFRALCSGVEFDSMMPRAHSCLTLV